MLKRRLNGKVLVSLFVLVMAVCISAFAGLRDESWSVNPSDFRYDMSLYFRMENKDFEDLSSFEIGAFVDDECRGLAEKLDLPQGESCLYMRIRSNQAEGEKISFYMKDKTTGQVILVKGEDGSELTFKADSRIGLPSDPVVLSPFYVAVFKIDGEVYKTYEVGYGDPIEAPEVPEKEGYTFNGWGDVPATMPAYDIEMHSSYSVNMYSLTFKIGEDEVYSGQVAYGSSIIVPDAPVKEGYSFSGWGTVPDTMPASDLVFVGSYEALSYKVVYKVDGEVVYMANFVYGETIDAYDEVPDKVGYTFSGWTDIPQTMPAHDVEVNGSYAINHYSIEFSISGEVLVSQQLAYGEEIIVPEAPSKEGYTFSGWGNVPDAMPAGNLVFEGSYSVNTYSVVFRIDQDVFQTVQLEYGAAIIAPEAPEMEGHTFSGWGDVPAVMPANDLVFVGTYADNYYTVTFRIGDEIIKIADLAYGSEILLPEVSDREGHTFSGWGDVPATMPASNMDIVGSYSVNSYIVTFRIDDEVIYTGELHYGAELVAPEAPGKEGYSFSGWGIVPSTMPASDLLISGTYEVNTYSLSFLIDGEVYYTTQIPYGSEITVPELPVKEGYSLVGWSDVPATMPSYDLNVDGTYSVNSYTLKFSVGDEVVFSGELPYGAEIIAPEVLAKEGYTFSGWGMVPATMPASDLEITGMYDVNIYNLTFMVDDEMFYSTTLAYGSEILAPVVPDIEGSAFSGWGEMPATMPANDLVIYGTYSVKYYALTFRIGEEVLFSGEMPYGAQIEAPVAPEREGHSFSGWGDVPSVMPNRNLEFNGSYVAKTYSLKFLIGDEVVSESKVEYGSEIIVPDAPVKEGYSFSGWGVV
ncbi:MAG: InlB B-repeat-containing protein, partial [Muribaculaceae bacterium]|nr:InlB B-repeat-containing protein [Muribaculaceae bacterium]